ncbi:MAG TPA: methylenetetrahydrofolate reductase [Chitinispirillaceae bacterium]|nr:methylenetetrahydrofolate reductase [Chitinispirillaceae bacterium]
MFFKNLENTKNGILLYGLTPPKATNSPDKLAEIALRHSERIRERNIDGVVLYDIQDESKRNNQDRPFPFLPTLDPVHYCELYMRGITLPKIVYQCVGKYSSEEFIKRLGSLSAEQYSLVLVGSASQAQEVRLSLDAAYSIRAQTRPDLLLGGIIIAERHRKKQDEQLRIVKKIEAGCTFFISQAVYDVEGCKNLLSDYFYYCHEHELPLVPVVITLTPCGSLKTLAFMEWLGIHVPDWLKNELSHSNDILKESIQICYAIAEQIVDFCNKKRLTFGFNIESVSIRKEEIDASIELVRMIESLLGR